MSVSQFSVKHLLAAAQRKLRQSFGRAQSANIWNALSDQVPRSGAVRIWSVILRGSVYFRLDRPSRPTFHLLRRPKDICLGVFAKGSSFAPVSRQGLRGLIIEFFFLVTEDRIDHTNASFHFRRPLQLKSGLKDFKQGCRYPA